MATEIVDSRRESGITASKKDATINFQSSPLVDFLQRERCKKNKMLKDATSKDINDIFFNDINWRFGLQGCTNHHKNLILTLFGETGTGKSNDGIYIADYITEHSKQPFSIDDICFTTTELIERIKEALKLDTFKDEITDEDIERTRGRCFILDEQKRGNFGVGSFREQEEKKTIMDVFRKLQTCTIFIAPTIHSNPTTHYFLEAWGIDYDNGLGKCIVYDRALIPRGYILCRKADDEIWNPYSQKKNDFIRDVIFGTERSRSNAMVEKAYKLIKHKGWKTSKTKKDKLAFISLNFGHIAIGEQEALLSLAILIERAKQEGMDAEDLIIKTDQ